MGGEGGRGEGGGRERGSYREGKGEVRSIDSTVVSHLLLSLVKDALHLTDEALGSHGASVQRLEVYPLIVQTLCVCGWVCECECVSVWVWVCGCVWVCGWVGGWVWV